MKQYRYETNCISANGDDISQMMDEAVPITYRTFRRHCDIQDWLSDKVYTRNSNQGITLANDWAVSYFKSRYRGQTCYVLSWSSIEYIWLAKPVPNLQDELLEACEGLIETYAHLARHFRDTEGEGVLVPAVRDALRAIDKARGIEPVPNSRNLSTPGEKV